MLRAMVIVVAVILACAGIVLIVCGVRMPGWQALGIGLVVLVGTLFERWRYRGAEEPANGPWQRTGERFLDPSTGDPIEVVFNPRTGERRYVLEKSRPASGPTP
jgi:hypothetical protein